ncbi:MAG: hypothetical protein AAF362_13265, partial [Pseudomonadota bacterium]
MKLPPNVRTNASADPMIAGRGQFSAISLASIIAIAMFMYLLEKIGVPKNYNDFLFAVFVAGTLCIIGFRSATVYYSDWFVCGTRVVAPINGMALAIMGMAGCFLLTLPGLYFSESTLAPAILAAPLAGLALSSFFTGPFISQSGTVSLGAFLAKRYKSRILTLLVLLAVTACCLLFLWSQLSIVAALGSKFAAVDEKYVLFATAIVMAITVVPGGLFAVLRANVFCYILAAVAILGAAIWLSAITTAIPFPQIGMGPAALDPVAALESQLDEVRIPRIGAGVDTGWPQITSISQAGLIFFILAVGFMALPALLSGFQPIPGPYTARKSAGWAILFCAVVLTAIPAIAAFTKLGIYSSLLGVTAEEVGDDAGWIFWWSGQTAVLTLDKPLFKICGSIVQSTAQVVAACGGNPDHAVGPADIGVHGELPLYALAEIMSLPQALTVLAAAGLVAASIAVANMFAFTIGSALSEDGRACFTSRSLPDTARVFAARLGVLFGIAAAAVLAENVNVSPLEPMLWAIAISASVIAPCLVLSIWWRRTTLLASISGMLIPACVLLAAFASRFETGFGLPWLKHAYTALGSYLAPNAGNLPVSIV